MVYNAMNYAEAGKSDAIRKTTIVEDVCIVRFSKA